MGYENKYYIVPKEETTIQELENAFKNCGEPYIENDIRAEKNKELFNIKFKDCLIMCNRAYLDIDFFLELHGKFPGLYYDVYRLGENPKDIIKTEVEDDSVGEFEMDTITWRPVGSDDTYDEDFEEEE
jgi:hypothetical protein